MVVKVTEKSFQREVCGSPRPVLVEFYASWCPKCAMMQDVLAQFSETHPEIKVCQVDTGEESRLANQYGIEKVPSFIAFDNGNPIGAVTGVVHEKVLLELFSALNDRKSEN